MPRRCSPRASRHLLVLGKRSQEIGTRPPRIHQAVGPRLAPGARHDAAQVGAINGALAPTSPLPVTRYLGIRMTDPHLATADHDTDLGADQPPGHAVVV